MRLQLKPGRSDNFDTRSLRKTRVAGWSIHRSEKRTICMAGLEGAGDLGLVDGIMNLEQSDDEVRGAAGPELNV